MIFRILFLLPLLFPPPGGNPANFPPLDVKSIDSILRETWKERKIKPVSACSDEEFLRRVTLDVIGRVPTLQEREAFLKSPDRDQKLEDLLAHPRFARYWAEVWVTILNGYGNPFQSNRDLLQRWLEKSFSEGRPYDGMVRELLTASGYSGIDGPVNFLVRYPRDPAAKVARTFLGIRLDCARCHDHPFDRWTNQDYRSLSRFFQAMDRNYVQNGNIRLRDNPARARGDKPRFLTGAKPVTTQWRQELAYHVTRVKPFARAFANRLWYHFFGRGIVNPPDDFSEQNQASVPELLEFLAGEVSRLRWDFPAIIRMICTSDAYQLSSRREGAREELEAAFAYRALKPLTGEQLFDSLAVALEIPNAARARPNFVRRFVDRTFGQDFTNLWEYRESIRNLMVKLSLYYRVPSRSVEVLYRRILSRDPTERERKLCEGKPPRDVVFALVNSNEFFFNH